MAFSSVYTADHRHHQVGILLPADDGEHCLPQASFAPGLERPTREERLGCREGTDRLAPLGGRADS